jgi:hypothetical protein
MDDGWTDGSGHRDWFIISILYLAVSLFAVIMFFPDPLLMTVWAAVSAVWALGTYRDWDDWTRRRGSIKRRFLIMGRGLEHAEVVDEDLLEQPWGLRRERSRIKSRGTWVENDYLNDDGGRLKVLFHVSPKGLLTIVWLSPGALGMKGEVDRFAKSNGWRQG